MQQQHQQQISRTLSSSNELLSRVLIHSNEQTSEHRLPITIVPSSSSSSSSLVTTTKRTIQTQTMENFPISSISKSSPSFAETQLLSVYYPSQNPKTSSKNDQCVYLEQQDRQPVRYRTAYDPQSSTQSTQTSSLSTNGSTLTIDGNDENTPIIKIQSGSQQSNNEQTKYSYEEYVVNLTEKQTRTVTSSSSSSTSSVTTVIAQNEECDSDHTSHLTFDEINTQSSTTSSPSTNNQRISSWPPVPDEFLITNNDEQKRSARVQFAEQLINIIPPSVTNSLTEESIPPPVIPRKNLTETDSRYPINQSKWVKTHMENSDIQTNLTTNRVDTLRSLFEQQQHAHSSTSNRRSDELEEKPSKHGVEIRFRINDSTPSTIYHAEPAKVLPEKSSSPKDQPLSSPFTLEQITQITGKQYKNFDNIGHYLPDGYTWQWNEIFWLSLTTTQRDQLKALEQQILSRQNSFDHSSVSSSTSSIPNEIKRFKSTVNITGAGAWQTNKSPQSTTGITKYTEINSVDENQSTISTFGSTYIKNNSQESLNSSSTNPTKNSDSQITTTTESGYHSGDDQQRLRINSSKIDRLSYEQFIIDYLSTYAKYTRSNNRVVLSINNQQIYSLVNDENTQSIYLNSINRNFLPFETELDELVIFVGDDIVLISKDRWLIYREKYENALWIKNLKRINRNIPSKLIPFIEQWISEHTMVEFNTQILTIDGYKIPLIGRSGTNLLDLYENQSLSENFSNEVLKYLIHIGEISYDEKNKLIKIANSELDVQRVLNNDNHIQYLVQWLEQLNQQKLITITEFNDIILYPNNSEQEICIKHEHVNAYMEAKMTSQEIDIIAMDDIAHILLSYNYVKYSSGQFIYGKNQNIQLDTEEFLWLQTIIRSVRIIEQIEQTEIELFDGQHTQTLQIPFEYMQPTKDPRMIAKYLIQNGSVRYEVNTGHYAYRYLAPEEKTEPIEHTPELELLSSHIRHIHIDKINEEIKLEFNHDPNHYLIVPSDWYQEISEHNFDRLYIINKLLTNGGILTDDHFLFNKQSYSLKTLSKEKEQLINYYVEFINNNNGIKYDHNTNLLLLENPLDGSELYLTSEHSQFIQDNQYRKQDMKSLLNKHSQLKQDEFNNWLLYYNDQCIQIPIDDDDRSLDDDRNLKLLFPYNKSLRLIQKTPSTTTLDIEQPSLENNYTVDPLLILANYIHRSATLYQDDYGRLVIKLNHDEIVIPYRQAKNSIEAIKTSPNRTGTIIARLIDGLGKVRSNQNGGIIITIGKNSLELSKEDLLSSTLIAHQQQQRISETNKTRLLIIHGDEINPTTRFYVQHNYDEHRQSTSVPQLITPDHYQDITLRDACVYVYRSDKSESYYENLAQYLPTKQTDLSSRVVRRMLKFPSGEEYFKYLNKSMPARNAQQLLRESEDLRNNSLGHYTNIRVKTPDRELEEQSTYYNVQNGKMMNESSYTYREEYSNRITRNASSSSRSPQTNLTTPEKNLTLPRSTTLSGQSNDGESESRATVSRSVSAAAKVATSKSDTMKSTTSSSGPSSREISPNRTNGSKNGGGGGGDEVKKEKKSKFRTPSFLRKRKEKKEAANKDKAEK